MKLKPSVFFSQISNETLAAVDAWQESNLLFGIPLGETQPLVRTLNFEEFYKPVDSMVVIHTIGRLEHN